MKGTTKVKVQGYLDDKWKNTFDGLTIVHESNYTIITVELKDQAHMHGILNLIRDLNLNLISIHSNDFE